MSSVDVLLADIQGLKAKGEFQKAVESLTAAVDGGEMAAHESDLLSELIQILVMTSRHKESLAVTARLSARIGFRALGPLANRFWLALVAILFMHAEFLLVPVARLIARRLVRIPLEDVKWSHSRALQFANFWHQITLCPSLSLIQIARATTRDELLLAMSWFAYSHAYRGLPLGGRLLQAVFDRVTAEGRRHLLPDLMPALIIAMFQQGDSRGALALFARYEAEFPDAPGFYRMLVLTVRIGICMYRGDLVGLRRAIDDAFTFSFSLEGSRHSIQIFAAKAALLAVEGRAKEARELLETARRVAIKNDNHLDFVIFYRFDTIAKQLLGESDACDASLASQKHFIDAYGGTGFDSHEQRLLLFVLAARRSSYPRRLLHLASLIGQTMLFGNRYYVAKILRRVPEFLLTDIPSYWGETNQRIYLRERLDIQGQESTERRFADISQKLSRAVLSPERFRSEARIDEAYLLEMLRECFAPESIVTFSDWAPTIEYVRQTLKVRGFTSFDPGQEVIRVPCDRDRYFIAVEIPTSEGFPERRIVGLIVTDLSLTTAGLFEAAFKLVVTLYSYQRSDHFSREMHTRSKELNAIAQTTQMLAHDVRKPFSMLEGILQLLATADGKDAAELSSRFLPEVRRAVGLVNGLITDVMLVGTKDNLTSEPVSPEALIKTTVLDSFRMLQRADVSLLYDFSHRSKVDVDVIKISRVFANITANALQAMPPNGTITFTTRETDDGFVTFTIHNTGTVIASEDVPHVFEAFFTKGKKGGTGLGLTICRRIVAAHGGNIRCVSSATLGTAFELTLPVAVGHMADHDLEFPGSGRDIVSFGTQLVTASPVWQSHDENEEQSELEIARAFHLSGRPLAVMIVDDEAVYRKILRDHVTRNDATRSTIHITEATTGQEALAKFRTEPCDVVIMDVDLGATDLNGFEVVARLRALGSSAVICMHSNRGLLEFTKTATDLGADAFLPKPLSRAHFLRLVAGAARTAQPAADRA